MIIRCICGRTTNNGLACSRCSIEKSTNTRETEKIDLFDLVDEKDHEKLKEMFKTNKFYSG